MDDRKLSYNFKKEIEPKVDAFLASQDKTLLIGNFNISKEPWRIMALSEFCRLGLKLQTKELPSADSKDLLTEVTFIKKKLSKHYLG